MIRFPTPCRATLFTVAMCLWAVAGTATAWQAGPVPKRARPPHWTPADLDVFFPDARQLLVGPRPTSPAAPVAALEDSGPQPPGGGASGSNAFSWSSLISAEVLEDEAKAIHLRLVGQAASRAEFKAGGYRKASDSFGQLAMLFRVASQYDGRVRWSDQGASLSELFAQASVACWAGTDSSFVLAQRRRDDLELLIRGERLELPAPAAEPPAWKSTVAFPTLMRRMEAAYRDEITPALASETAFNAAADKVRHESQMLSVLARGIGDLGYSYADEAFYQEHVQMLRAGAKALSEAATQGDFNRAATAGIAIDRSCADCHLDYRN